MIDHVLGRPSVQFRKIQVLAVVSFWSLYLARGNIHGPPIIRKLSRRISIRLTAWQNLVITLLGLYVSRNFGKLLGLECPEPLANLYSRSYFRATWVTTALDAGFWTAMRIRRKWLRDLASVVFSVYYLIAAEQADEKVRKVRGLLTVDHLRVSWNKPTTPYISFLTKLLRPRLTRYPPRAIRIPRPPDSSYQEPVSGWLYFDGPLSALKIHTRVIIDVPGGGFVAMSPRHHDDKLLGWAGKTGLPILSLEYKKAPEHPYPYALNECYDAYRTVTASRGRCVGLSGECRPKIVISGDSAGANLATGLVLMVLQASSGDALGWSNELSIPPPDGMVLIYPGLDMNIGNWMTEEQMCLIKDRRTRDTNKNVLRRKSEDYSQLTPAALHHSDDEEDDKGSPPPIQPLTTSPLSASPATSRNPAAGHNSSIGAPLTKTTSFKPKSLKTRLAMSSMISYFNDRILTPEMMRAMIILYVGPHNRPDFATDYHLSPLLAPESLLARFPKVYFLTGERDPLVDDTVIFAGRLRQAKASAWLERKELGLLRPDEREFNERDHVEVNLITGVSHGFLQFVSIFPEGWKYIFRCADWMEDIFASADASDSTTAPTTPGPTAFTPGGTRSQTPNGTSRGEGERKRQHRRVRTESSGDEDRPLEMSMLSSSSNKGAANGDAASHKYHPNHDPNHAHAHDQTRAADRGSRGSRHRGQPRKSAMRKKEDSDLKRNQSSVSLASEDDLLGRRMKGLAGGLMGEGTGEGS